MAEWVVAPLQKEQVSDQLHGRLFNPREGAPITHWISWVGPRTGLNAVDYRKFPASAGNVNMVIQSVAY
jgi:hypothetical protein